MDSAEKITARIAERKALAESILRKRPLMHKLFTDIRERFGARLTYLEADGICLGKCEIGVPIGWNRPKRKKR